LKHKGLTLIEVVISMWIFAIVVMSTVVCSTAMNSKVSQRKLQALNIARSELERVRYYIMSGGMSALENGAKYTGDKQYSRFFQVIERRVVKLEDNGKIKNTETWSEHIKEPQHKEKEGTEQPPFYANLNATPSIPSNTMPETWNVPDSLAGYMIASIKANPYSYRDQMDPVPYSDKDGSLSILYKGFIADVVIKAISNLYQVTITVGWLDYDAKGKASVKTVELESRIYSNVTLGI